MNLTNRSNECDIPNRFINNRDLTPLLNSENHPCLLLINYIKPNVMNLNTLTLFSSSVSEIFSSVPGWWGSLINDVMARNSRNVPVSRSHQRATNHKNQRVSGHLVMRNGVNKNNDENHAKKKAKIKCFREVIKVMTFKSLKSDDLKFKEIRHTALSCFSTSVASSFVWGTQPLSAWFTSSMSTNTRARFSVSLCF